MTKRCVRAAVEGQRQRSADNGEPDPAWTVPVVPAGAADRLGR